MQLRTSSLELRNKYNKKYKYILTQYKLVYCHRESFSPNHKVKLEFLLFKKSNYKLLV